MKKPSRRGGDGTPWYPARQIGERMSREELDALLSRKDLSAEDVRRLERERDFATGKLEVVYYDRPDDSQSERSASATVESINRVLRPFYDAGTKVVAGGRKGASRHWGSEAQRAATEKQCVEWYRTKKEQTPAPTDRQILKSQGRGVPLQNGSFYVLTGRTLSRLKSKHLKQSK